MAIVLDTETALIEQTIKKDGIDRGDVQALVDSWKDPELDFQNLEAQLEITPEEEQQGVDFEQMIERKYNMPYGDFERKYAQPMYDAQRFDATPHVYKEPEYSIPFTTPSPNSTPTPAPTENAGKSTRFDGDWVRNSDGTLSVVKKNIRQE